MLKTFRALRVSGYKVTETDYRILTAIMALKEAGKPTSYAQISDYINKNLTKPITKQHVGYVAATHLLPKHFVIDTRVHPLRANLSVNPTFLTQK